MVVAAEQSRLVLTEHTLAESSTQREGDKVVKRCTLTLLPHLLLLLLIAPAQATLTMFDLNSSINPTTGSATASASGGGISLSLTATTNVLTVDGPQDFSNSIALANFSQGSTVSIPRTTFSVSGPGTWDNGVVDVSVSGLDTSSNFLYVFMMDLDDGEEADITSAVTTPLAPTDEIGHIGTARLVTNENFTRNDTHVFDHPTGRLSSTQTYQGSDVAITVLKIASDVTSFTIDTTPDMGFGGVGGIQFALGYSDVDVPIVLYASDFDGNDLVNLDDYNILTSNFLTAGTQADGDATGDGFIDLDDFVQWRADFEDPGIPASAVVTGVAVPEPSALLLASTALALACVRRRTSVSVG